MSPVGLEFAAHEAQIRECANELVQSTSENVCSGKVILSSHHFVVLIDALEYIHRELKLVHRDIKLTNMLIVNVANPVCIFVSLFLPRVTSLIVNVGFIKYRNWKNQNTSCL